MKVEGGGHYLRAVNDGALTVLILSNENKQILEQTKYIQNVFAVYIFTTLEMNFA